LACGPRHRTAEAELDSGASPSQVRSREMSLTGRPRLSARAGEERREARAVLGRGAQLGPEEKRGRQWEELGHAGEEGKRGRASWAARGGEEREGKNKVGQPKREREGERKRNAIQMMEKKQ
jgi:hypothetical protein